MLRGRYGIGWMVAAWLTIVVLMVLGIVLVGQFANWR